ncbi:MULTISPECIES: polyamine ABC transporter substrate-binding protein [unclassified Mesorhizobium]|uniref:polyamine ABC transporter substrate-binding protein n=1 Tax=unclassified Mesorhizobium TaxID=325217 RepID=UPI00112ED558|nr:MULTISPECIES: polyamine ABC transporter substrate-binding protein [unclassified Mesorhizobium]TPJ42866.1 polyamine ABC transporter substrate-binding protein [Mesorhizobium sp. B2-6-6]MBZ9896897.1 polyamine ABC transporter substrate-binding protein [Mesorhizobium sp. BR1-1-6]MBZ9916184.1 polyamine ABC transporter substrate-binding protein [Mesorhizobium sp. BR1-1-7]MBZ9955711.1 polyamine ABC transporter substrate-binding protein [Mesorhizobium sp. BR1-1-15]MBZ9957083.1 polyamine ABC transpor
MIRKALWLSATSAFLALFTLGGHAEDRVVNVFNWSDYIDPTVIDDFTKQTGIKVVYDTFDSNEILETKLLAGGSGYDVVVPSGNFLARQIQAGVFQKLDKSKLPNLSNMWDTVSERTAKYDPGNEYSINYMWGTVGLGYNIKKVQAALGTDKIDSWDVFFNPEKLAKLKDCGVYVLDSPTDIFPTAFKYLGINPETTSPDDFAKAEELMMKIRPYIRKFHSSEYINALANGDICLAVGWSGDVFQARNRAEEAKQGVEIGYAVPKEGAEMWFDQMAIPADAPHVAEAHEFLNYMMKPEVIAKSSNAVLYANGNKASQQFVDKALLEDPAVYPDAATLQKLFTISPYDPKTQRVITRTWTKIVTGQ